MRRSLPIITAALVAVLLAVPAAAGASPPDRSATTASRPDLAAAGASRPDLAVAAASLIVSGTGQVLYRQHSQAERAIASTTKIMTALITLQRVSNLNTIFRQMNWEAAPGDSQIGLERGERMSVRDLLYALLIPSADDAAMDLAHNVGGGSVRRFVSMMNAEAKQLGLNHTHYTTPSGLDTPGNYSTAYDLNKLSNYVIRHYPFFRRVVAMPSAILKTGRYVRRVTTTDYLLNKYPWIHGIKTGHTNDAGYVLVSEGRRSGLSLIGSVLGTASETARDNNALALLEWGFDNFHRATLVTAGAVLTRPGVHDSSKRAVVVAQRSVRLVVPKAQRIRLVAHLRHKQLTGPLAKGTVVGTAAVFVGRHQVASVPLVLAHALPKVSTLAEAGRVLARPISLLLLALAVGAAVAFAARRRRPRLVAHRRLEER